MMKLIVSDVDGTLVPDGSDKLNPELFDVILKLRERGIQFAVASGRSPESVEQAFEPIKKKIFYIANNGAYIGCCGRELYSYPIERKLVRRLIERLREYPELTILYASASDNFVDTADESLIRWLREGYRMHLTRVDDLLRVAEPCVKLSIYKSEGIEEATAEIREEFGDQLKIACSGQMWMDCMAKGVNKGEAVRTIQESLEILPEETMAFGDQLNDLEMLGRAYYSFAVANARDEVRAAARFEADRNVNDGVLKILKLFL